MTLKSLQIVRETATITAIIFAIIATATFLSVVLTYGQIPQQIIAYFTEMGATFTLFWIALACLILGTFVEIVPVFYLTVPIFAAITISKPSSPLCCFRCLCRDWHDHTSCLCWHLYERQCHSRKSSEGIQGSSIICWRRYYIHDIHDVFAGSINLASLATYEITRGLPSSHYNKTKNKYHKT